MNLTELVSKRRSYRKLKPIEITPEIIQELVKIVELAPSCDNNQPWRFIFVHDKTKIKELHEVFHDQNKWIKNASLLIGVFSNKDADCTIEDRDYFLFDTGIATSYLILKATEMGLVAHPTSYYNEKKAKQILNIPVNNVLISILAIGKHHDTSEIVLTPDQEENELERPKRLSMQYSSYLNNYIEKYEENKEKIKKFFE